MKIAKTVFLAGLIALGLACGYSKPANTPAMPGSMPNITQLAPNNANSGGPAFTLTVNGANFAGNAKINWNGMALTTTPMSGNKLVTTVPASDITTAGSAMVTVTNPGTPGGQYGGGTLPETSNSMTFTIN
ncbi:MAG TPA: IPT/TIG domain-containing protein [Candidatus Aquilonibacter sp.]|nr:IPT/TIG domain-containing protein [Candidatus Aquilonibacter sp.]